MAAIKISLSHIIAQCAAGQASDHEQQLLNTIINKTFVDISGVDDSELKTDVIGLQGNQDMEHQITAESTGDVYKVVIDRSLYMIAKKGVNKKDYEEQHLSGAKPTLMMQDVEFVVVDPNNPRNCIIQGSKPKQTLIASHVIKPSIIPHTNLFDAIKVKVCNDDNILTIAKLDAAELASEKAAIQGSYSKDGTYTDPKEVRNSFLVSKQQEIVKFDRGARQVPAVAAPAEVAEGAEGAAPAEVAAPAVPNLNVRKLEAIETELAKVKSKYFHSDNQAQNDTDTFEQVKQLLPNKTLSVEQKLMRYYDIFEHSATQHWLLKKLSGRHDLMQEVAIKVRAVYEVKTAYDLVDARSNLDATVKKVKRAQKEIEAAQKEAQEAPLFSKDVWKKRREFLAHASINEALCGLYKTVKESLADALPDDTNNTIKKIQAITQRDANPVTTAQKLTAVSEIIKLATEEYNAIKGKGMYYRFFPVSADNDTKLFVKNIAKAGAAFREAIDAKNNNTDIAKIGVAEAITKKVALIPAIAPIVPAALLDSDDEGLGIF